MRYCQIRRGEGEEDTSYATEGDVAASRYGETFNLTYNRFKRSPKRHEAISVVAHHLIIDQRIPWHLLNNYCEIFDAF